MVVTVDAEDVAEDAAVVEEVAEEAVAAEGAGVSRCWKSVREDYGTARTWCIEGHKVAEAIASDGHVQLRQRQHAVSEGGIIWRLVDAMDDHPHVTSGAQPQTACVAFANSGVGDKAACNGTMIPQRTASYKHFLGQF